MKHPHLWLRAISVVAIIAVMVALPGASSPASTQQAWPAAGIAYAEKEEGLQLLQPGEIVFAVVAEMSSNEPGRRIAASIGVARPTDWNHYGYLSEHHAYGMTEQEAGDYAEDLAATMLATTLDIPFDADNDYNARKEQYMMGGEMVDTTSITMAATAAVGGVWTTVLSVAVLI